jgi:tRNA G18 (ribose-2'-O)-methylase SpoU
MPAAKPGSGAMAELKRQMRKSAEAAFAEGLERSKSAASGRHEFAVVLDHLTSSYNIGKIFRSANAFGASEVIVVGNPVFDPSAAKGGFGRVPFQHFQSVGPCQAYLAQQHYTLILLDPAESQKLWDISLPTKCAIVIGNEATGLRNWSSYLGECIAIAIPRYGVVRSVNASVAASIAMYEYVRQHSA